MPAGGICNFIAPESMSCVSKKVSIASTGPTNIAGGSLCVESEASSFAGNVAMNGNAKVNGGCFINGEAFIPHMTTQKQVNYTDNSGECVGFLNPTQTFILLPGDRTLIEAAAGNVDALYLPLEFDAESLVAFIIRVASSVVKGETFTPDGPSIPLPIKPLLVHVMSKGVLNQIGLLVPTLKTALIKEHPDLAKGFALLDSEPDFNVLGHRHKFIGPACSYTDTTADLYKEAAAVDGKELVKHKPCEVNGGESLAKQVINDEMDKVKNFFKEWGKTLWKSMVKSVWG